MNRALLNQELSGRTVVVTRARRQASQLVTELEVRGAKAIELPVIEIADPSDGGQALRSALGHVDTYDWLVVTSVNTAERIAESLESVSAKVAAIGTGTAEVLKEAGIDVDLVPDEFVAESLLSAFPNGDGKVLIPRAAVARDVLPDGLREKGWTVDVVEAYRTVEVEPPPQALAAAAKADAITFTASSTVSNYVRIAGTSSIPPLVACIGPITAKTAEENGIHVDVVAAEHTIEGLVASLVDAFSTR